MNVLFLTHRLPYAPNRGDRIRAYHLLREMSRFASVSLFSLVHDDDEASHVSLVPFARRVSTSRVPRLRNLIRGALHLPSRRPLTHTLLDAPDARTKIAALVKASRPDLVIAYCSGMARFAFEAPLGEFPVVVDLVDVDSQKWRRLSERTGPPKKWIYAREARTLSQFEDRASRQARCVLVVNERERDALATVAPKASIRIVGNGIDVPAFSAPEPVSETAVVVFCGVMDYEPNVEGVLWFAEQIWPRVRATRPDAKFVVVGANPTAAVTALARRDRSIEVTGRVEAVQPHLWRAAVSVAPLRLARGVQNKVLEALAAGLPAVVTSSVRAGLPAGVERGCLVADEAEAFSRLVVELLNQPPQARRGLAAASRVETMAWSVELAPLQGILEEAAR